MTGRTPRKSEPKADAAFASDIGKSTRRTRSRTVKACVIGTIAINRPGKLQKINKPGRLANLASAGRR